MGSKGSDRSFQKMNDIENIKIEIIKAYTRVVRLLSYRPRSEKEIRDRLTRKNFDKMIIDQVIIKLKEDNLINDDEFAEWWTEQRQDFKGKSKMLIKYELAEKGINRNTIDATLSEAKDDYKTARELINRKNRTFERYTGDEYKKKVIGFLKRKGYSWNVINKILKDEDN